MMQHRALTIPTPTLEPDRYRAFQRAYRDDPEAFIHDCLVWPAAEAPTDYQREIVAALPLHKRTSARGPHGLGKTAMMAWQVHWFALTRDGEDWKIPTTAGAWRQLTHYLWPEIRKWARRLRWDVIGRAPYDPRAELLALSLRLRTGEAFAVASSDPSLIEGAHADHMLYLFDESKSISGETFDAAEGAFSGSGEALAVANSTPGEPLGRFYDIHARRPGYEDWHVRHVTTAEAIAAGRISRQWVAQRARQWGIASAVFQNRVGGEFAASDEDGLIPLAWIEAANERWRAWDDAGEKRGYFTAIGVDVADGGGDATVLAPRTGWLVPSLRVTSAEKTMETAGRVAGLLAAHPDAYTVVDTIGVGAGVVARLREQFVESRVDAFNGAARSDATDRSGELGFLNRRAHAWWNLRELLDPENDVPLALPPDDELTGDLTAPHWKVVSGGKIQIEAKAEIAKRLGRSPDKGDAVAYAFVPRQSLDWYSV